MTRVATPASEQEWCNTPTQPSESSLFTEVVPFRVPRDYDAATRGGTTQAFQVQRSHHYYFPASTLIRAGCSPSHFKESQGCVCNTLPGSGSCLGVGLVVANGLTTTPARFTLMVGCWLWSGGWGVGGGDLTGGRVIIRVNGRCADGGSAVMPVVVEGFPLHSHRISHHATAATAHYRRSSGGGVAQYMQHSGSDSLLSSLPSISPLPAPDDPHEGLIYPCHFPVSQLSRSLSLALLHPLRGNIYAVCALRMGLRNTISLPERSNWSKREVEGDG